MNFTYLFTRLNKNIKVERLEINIQNQKNIRISKLKLIICNIWEDEKILDEWQVAAICPIHKKGNELDSCNYSLKT